MELSPTKTKEANKYKVPVQYLLMADLCALGYTEVDAYNIAYPENSILTLQQNKGIRENIFEKEFALRYPERPQIIKFMQQALNVEEVKWEDLTTLNLRKVNDYIKSVVISSSAYTYTAILKD